MAICNENDDKPLNYPKLHVEAIQSIVPKTPSDPTQSRRELNIPLGSGVCQRRFQVVMFYKASDDDHSSGFVMAGWIRESLGRALAEEPIFAGRLKRIEDGDDDHGDLLNIVSNDSGVRLIEATIPMELIQFLNFKENHEAQQTQLVFWDNINQQNPQFFPLFYVQVTNFKCGGFSIGISCSLLVADLFSMISFLKKWSDIHSKVLSGSDSPKTPLFNLLNFKATISSSPSLLNIDPHTHSKPTQSLIFKLAGKIPNWDDEMYKNLSALCIHEAAKRLGGKTDSNFLLILKDTSGNMKIVKGSNEAVDKKPIADPIHDFVSASWDDLEVDKMFFNEVVKPSHVSSWISSVSEEWLVMVVQDVPGMSIVVTLPS